MRHNINVVIIQFECFEVRSRTMEPSELMQCEHCHSRFPRDHAQIHARRCMATVLANHRQQRVPQEEREGLRSGHRWRQEETYMCYLCRGMFPMGQMNSHRQRCPNREVQCQMCGGRMPRNRLEDHLVTCIGDQSSDEDQDDIILLGHIIGSNHSLIHEIRPYANNRSESSFRRLPGQNRPWTFGAQSRQISQAQVQINRLVNLLRQRNNLLLNLMHTSNVIERHSAIQLGYLNNLHIVQTEIQRLASSNDPDRRGGMVPAEISSLPKKSYQSNGRTEDTCSICYTDFNQDDEVFDLECNHLFHVTCLGQWLVINRSCPNCKRAISFGEDSSAQTGNSSVGSQPRVIEGGGVRGETTNNRGNMLLGERGAQPQQNIGVDNRRQTRQLNGELRHSVRLRPEGFLPQGQRNNNHLIRGVPPQNRGTNTMFFTMEQMEQLQQRRERQVTLQRMPPQNNDGRNVSRNNSVRFRPTNIFSTEPHAQVQANSGTNNPPMIQPVQPPGQRPEPIAERPGEQNEESNGVSILNRFFRIIQRDSEY